VVRLWSGLGQPPASYPSYAGIINKNDSRLTVNSVIPFGLFNRRRFSSPPPSGRATGPPGVINADGTIGFVPAFPPNGEQMVGEVTSDEEDRPRPSVEEWAEWVT
jgi:hypothetical protein